MIELKYDQVMNDNFVKAIQKLAEYPMNIKMSYTTNKLINDLQKYRKEITKEALEFFKDEVPPGDSMTEEDFSKLKEVQEKKAEEFGSRVVKLDRTPLKLSEVKGLMLSPKEMEFIKVISDPKDLAAFDLPPEPPSTAA